MFHIFIVFPLFSDIIKKKKKKKEEFLPISCPLRHVLSMHLYVCAYIDTYNAGIWDSTMVKDAEQRQTQDGIRCRL